MRPETGMMTVVRHVNKPLLVLVLFTLTEIIQVKLWGIVQTSIPTVNELPDDLYLLIVFSSNFNEYRINVGHFLDRKW